MKRARAANFNSRELKHLSILIEKFPIVKNKKTDAATVRKKQEAWLALAAVYNATTDGPPRTADNLMACFKNQKNKLKKQHSSSEVIVKGEGPQPQVEETPPQEEGPSSQPLNDPVLENYKSLIESSLDGLHTKYDGDAHLIAQQQEILPRNIEIDTESSTTTEERKNIANTHNTNRVKVMKKKNYSSLEVNKDKRRSISSFIQLAKERKELIFIKKTLALRELENQQQLQNLNKEIAQRRLEFEKTKNELELNFLKEKHELELKRLRNNVNYY